MKKIIILIPIFIAVIFQSCKKDPSPGDNFDFSNTIPPYVTIKSLKDILVAPGDVAKITLQMRTSLQQKVTATYKVEGAINIPNATIVFDKEAKETIASLTVPADAVSSAKATFTLIKAQTEDGRALTIGVDANAVAQKLLIVVK